MLVRCPVERAMTGVGKLVERLAPVMKAALGHGSGDAGNVSLNQPPLYPTQNNPGVHDRVACRSHHKRAGWVSG